MLKLYGICVIQGALTVYNTEFSDGVLTRMTYMFGLVVFGNLIDNISKPKFVLIIC